MERNVPYAEVARALVQVELNRPKGLDPGPETEDEQVGEDEPVDHDEEP